MGRDPLAQRHRVIELLLDQLVAFELDLPAADVERRQDLVVRRRRRVRHVRFVERLLDLLPEVLVVHVDHRALAQRGQRLVRRVRDVDADARAVRVGHQAAYPASASSSSGVAEASS